MSLFKNREDAKQTEKLEKEIKRLAQRVVRLQEAVGRVEARQCAGAATLEEAEFRAFSQWGEDGIIQHLVRRVAIPRKVFVEFGVESYAEANTRFLLTNDNWSGLIMDGCPDHIRCIRKSGLYWQHNLKAVEAFITRDNINPLLAEHGMAGEIGLLSIDIDGNDYWVWKAIDAVSPAILVMEYNARFGPTEAVTIPYDAKFTRQAAHHSRIYYGASLAALTKLSKTKGYALVGCNTAGNNCFFVRRDLLPAGMPEVTPAEAFKPCLFREARDKEGRLAMLDFEAEQRLVFSLPLEHV